ncbi:Kunitz/Bovine pancreatic trypsin inhibitor domain protein [Ancylostoma duodenale]|uniref:Kunitz/Bovine pancreatic trypsin inhibitor domain protein n=1 Tax=Ancylostoma duodenale TaxID=51022 RepID=A0A0C2GHU2_9BILA|nr:Kunitz/Bovine pancreatic trypsin inhibitor domain protein [Ancylostoma duodenale]
MSYTACPVWINPCAIGQPTLTSDQHPFRCHQGAPCSSGYYCHIGFDESTTACCPSQGDPCSLIVKEGRGTQSIQRWFYNQKTRQCQPFTYKGMGGNENNFLLREHCESTCPVWVNACPQGEAYLLPTGRPQQCDPANEDSCPETHWCHPGPDSTTTMCCPGRVDPCTTAKSEGEGPLQLTRYYFDASRRQCLQFSFRGIRGNANNFMTKESCEARCPVQVNPCPLTMNSLSNAHALLWNKTMPGNAMVSHWRDKGHNCLLSERFVDPQLLFISRHPNKIITDASLNACENPID